MTQLWCRRIGLTLIPDGNESLAELEKLPKNKTLKVEVRQERNLQHHKLYWALCHRIGDALGIEPEAISDILKIATNHCIAVKTTTYGELKLPKSISFAAMDQNQFREFFNRCVDVIELEWCIARKDLKDAIKDLLKDSETQT